MGKREYSGRICSGTGRQLDQAIMNDKANLLNPRPACLCLALRHHYYRDLLDHYLRRQLRRPRQQLNHFADRSPNLQLQVLYVS